MQEYKHILLTTNKINVRTLRFILFHAGVEDVFDAEDDEHGEDGVPEDDEQGVPEVFERHGCEEH